MGLFDLGFSGLSKAPWDHVSALRHAGRFLRSPVCLGDLSCPNLQKTSEGFLIYLVTALLMKTHLGWSGVLLQKQGCNLHSCPSLSVSSECFSGDNGWLLGKPLPLLEP